MLKNSVSKYDDIKHSYFQLAAQNFKLKMKYYEEIQNDFFNLQENLFSLFP